MKNKNLLDAIRGCLIGGAAGDALGYPVEFMTLDEIYKHYPVTGITDYKLDSKLGKGIISDDTQMTLFTANGILNGVTQAKLHGSSAPIENYIYRSYLDWLATQTDKEPSEGHRPCWLTEIKELCVTRAPGNTCISALQSGMMGTIKEPINNSKGCGGIMRVAPVALFNGPLYIDVAKTAAITHGHPLGYISAEAMVFIICRIIYEGCPNNDALYYFVNDCNEILHLHFFENVYLNELLDIMELAVKLSRNNQDDTANIARIGEGWVTEEALGIALYCALKYQDDFSAAIIAAVNHNGDSDSTGAITGNIVGALIGYDNIPAKWKQNLQLHDLILEIADDLYNGGQISKNEMLENEKWIKKYGN